MGKLQTPEWVLKGYKSQADYDKAKGVKPEKKKSGSKGGLGSGKTYKIKQCPKCKGTDVGVVLRGEEGKRADEWECRKCKWQGRNVDEKEVSEDEFLELMEKE